MYLTTNIVIMVNDNTQIRKNNEGVLNLNFIGTFLLNNIVIICFEVKT